MTFPIVITTAVVTAGNAHGTASTAMTATAMAPLLIRLIHSLAISRSPPVVSLQAIVLAGQLEGEGQGRFRAARRAVGRRGAPPAVSLG
jgi:hypothetical protein